MTCEIQLKENQLETKRSFTSKLLNVKPTELRRMVFCKEFGIQNIYDCMKHIMYSLHYYPYKITAKIHGLQFALFNTFSF